MDIIINTCLNLGQSQLSKGDPGCHSMYCEKNTSPKIFKNSGRYGNVTRERRPIHFVNLVLFTSIFHRSSLAPFNDYDKYPDLRLLMAMTVRYVIIVGVVNTAFVVRWRVRAHSARITWMLRCKSCDLANKRPSNMSWSAVSSSWILVIVLSWVYIAGKSTDLPT